jgi:hypothetical protein
MTAWESDCDRLIELKHETETDFQIGTYINS